MKIYISSDRDSNTFDIVYDSVRVYPRARIEASFMNWRADLMDGQDECMV